MDECVKNYKDEEHVKIILLTINNNLNVLTKNLKMYFRVDENWLASYEWVRSPFQKYLHRQNGKRRNHKTI